MSISVNLYMKRPKTRADLLVACVSEPEFHIGMKGLPLVNVNTLGRKRRHAEWRWRENERTEAGMRLAERFKMCHQST